MDLQANLEDTKKTYASVMIRDLPPEIAVTFLLKTMKPHELTALTSRSTQSIYFLKKQYKKGALSPDDVMKRIGAPLYEFYKEVSNTPLDIVISKDKQLPLYVDETSKLIEDDLKELEKGIQYELEKTISSIKNKLIVTEIEI